MNEKNSNLKEDANEPINREIHDKQELTKEERPKDDRIELKPLNISSLL
nr:hypothetical protein [uncultured Desulfobacter sp.]